MAEQSNEDVLESIITQTSVKSARVDAEKITPPPPSPRTSTSTLWDCWSSPPGRGSAFGVASTTPLIPTPLTVERCGSCGLQEDRTPE